MSFTVVLSNAACSAFCLYVFSELVLITSSRERGPPSGAPSARSSLTLFDHLSKRVSTRSFGRLWHASLVSLSSDESRSWLSDTPMMFFLSRHFYAIPVWGESVARSTVSVSHSSLLWIPLLLVILVPSSFLIRGPTLRSSQSPSVFSLPMRVSSGGAAI